MGWIKAILGLFALGVAMFIFAGSATQWAIDRYWMPPTEAPKKPVLVIKDAPGEGPYDRLGGVIEVGKDMECGPDAQYYDSVKPGGCVAVVWALDLHQGNKCVPIDDLHVSRTITDSNGVHYLPRIERYFGPGKRDFASTIRRPFILPEFSIPGPARYHSEACFRCQGNTVDKIVCKTTPDVDYQVDYLP